MERAKKNAAAEAPVTEQAEVMEAEAEVEAPAEGIPAESLFIEGERGAEMVVPPKADEKRMFSEEEMQAMIAAAVKDALAKRAAELTRSAGSEDMVTILYLAEVSPESELLLPGYGSMRPMSYLEVPKKEFGNKFMSSLVRKLIHRRHLIVMNGLNADERRRWDCDYKAGEVLTEREFDRMLDFDTDTLAGIFENLCEEHQRFVATRFITAKERNDNRVSIEKARRINEISKKYDKEGMLKPVLEAFGKEVSN